jgi:hypothetical protein
MTPWFFAPPMHCMRLVHPMLRSDALLPGKEVLEWCAIQGSNL